MSLHHFCDFVHVKLQAESFNWNQSRENLGDSANSTTHISFFFNMKQKGKGIPSLSCYDSKEKCKVSLIIYITIIYILFSPCKYLLVINFLPADGISFMIVFYCTSKIDFQ